MRRLPTGEILRIVGLIALVAILTIAFLGSQVSQHPVGIGESI